MSNIMSDVISKNNAKNLDFLPHGDMVKMKLSFKESINDRLNQVITEDMSDNKIRSIRQYIIARMLNRVKPSIDGLRVVSQETVQEIDVRIKKEITPLFSKEQRKTIKEASNKRYKKQGHGLLGTGKRRLYFPLITEDEKSETQNKIEKHLNDKGYFIRDYAEGYATDTEGKQEYKIGKLIKDNSELSLDFMNDKTRLSKQQYFVLSDYANDIAYMSTRRGWETCMSYDGVYKEKPPYDIEDGALIGYLISKNDPYIFNPLARVLFKPLHNGNGDTIYHVNQCYGLVHDGFKDTAKKLASQISSNEYGVFKLPENIYNDACPHQQVKLPEEMTAIELLDILNIGYKSDSVGNITIDGDLNLGHLNLKELPDLTKVEILGDFTCSSNELTSLIGSPQKVTGSFHCEYNKITTLQGVPEKIVEDFCCGFNELTSLEYAPQEVGGYFDCCRNQLTSLQYAPKKLGRAFSCKYNKLTTLEGAPQKIQGVFYCEGNNLTSLAGAPQVVDGDFNCSENGLMTLERGPKIVKGDYLCSNNKLNSLLGAPKKADGFFNCNYNELTSLVGAPKNVGGGFYCESNKLTSLIGAPQTLKGRFSCSDNQLMTTLIGAPSSFKMLFSDLNKGNAYNCYDEIPIEYLKPVGVNSKVARHEYKI